MEKKLKEVLLQVEDERRNSDQFKNEVGFGLHLKCNKLVQTSSKPRDLHLILRGNFSKDDFDNALLKTLYNKLIPCPFCCHCRLYLKCKYRGKVTLYFECSS